VVLQDLLGGQLQMAIDNMLTALPPIRSGRLLALGVTAAKPVGYCQAFRPSTA